MRQIKEIASSLEPNQNAEELGKGVAQAVVRLKADDVIVNYRAVKAIWIRFGEAKIGVDSTGKPKAEFMYDESELSTNKEEKIEI